MSARKSVEKNQYIKHYGEHNISPVHQDISNFELHLLRREKLYITLGMPAAFFAGRRLLEIGPGGGYNALAYFRWNAKVDFVEPNKKAQDELPELLGGHAIGGYKLFKGKFEEHRARRKYDIVIAEGFIPLMENRLEIVGKIFSYLSPGGVCVVTCVDDVSYFFEYLRKIIAYKLFSCLGVSGFDEKVAILAKAYASHYRTLKYASRPVEDWIVDNLMNPYSFGDLFSVGELIDAIPCGFEVLGCSPSMFTNYSWYKDYGFDSSAEFKRQFAMKRHNLIMAGVDETVRPKAKNDELAKLARRIRAIIEENGDRLDTGVSRKIAETLDEIRRNLSDADRRVPEAVGEAAELFLDASLTVGKISRARRFASAFGRGQQYVSIVKRFTHDVKGK